MAEQYKEKYQQVFKKYDTNGDGFIDKKELQSFTKKFVEEIVGEKLGEKDIDQASEELLKMLDENGDKCELLFIHLLSV
jgi:Ca2+-binding EF-hand superfamily protein